MIEYPAGDEMVVATGAAVLDLWLFCVWAVKAIAATQRVAAIYWADFRAGWRVNRYRGPYATSRSVNGVASRFRMCLDRWLRAQHRC